MKVHDAVLLQILACTWLHLLAEGSAAHTATSAPRASHAAAARDAETSAAEARSALHATALPAELEVDADAAEPR